MHVSNDKIDEKKNAGKMILRESDRRNLRLEILTRGCKNDVIKIQPNLSSENVLSRGSED